MTAHPLPPRLRWLGFPLLALAAAAICGLAMAGLDDRKWLKGIFGFSLTALATTIPFILWPRAWFGLLIAPILEVAATGAFVAYQHGGQYLEGLVLLLLVPHAMIALAVLAGGLAMMHALYIGKPGRTWAWASFYLAPGLLCVGSLAWQERPDSVAEWVGAPLLCLGHFAAARIAVALARRRRTDVGTPPGECAPLLPKPDA